MSDKKMLFVLRNGVHAPATEEEIAEGKLALFEEGENGTYVELPPPADGLDVLYVQNDKDVYAEATEEQINSGMPLFHKVDGEFVAVEQSTDAVNTQQPPDQEQDKEQEKDKDTDQVDQVEEEKPVPTPTHEEVMEATAARMPALGKRIQRIIEAHGPAALDSIEYYISTLEVGLPPVDEENK